MNLVPDIQVFVISVNIILIMGDRKLQKEIEWLQRLKNDYIMGDHNEIYDRLKNIAKCKYLKGEAVQQYQENFFRDFIENGEAWSDGINDNAYRDRLHEQLLNMRREIDPNFLRRK